MVDQNFLGEFEEIVLLAVLRLRDNAYGVTIRQEIEERAGRSTSYGAIYTTLDRLEEKGFVTSRQGEATPERGGRGWHDLTNIAVSPLNYPPTLLTDGDVVFVVSAPAPHIASITNIR